MQYPAEAVSECNDSAEHVHQDSQRHSCDLCEFQITQWVNHATLGELPYQHFEITKARIQDAPTLESNYTISLRGPPAC